MCVASAGRHNMAPLIVLVLCLSAIQEQFLRRKTFFGLRIDNDCLCRNSHYTLYYTTLLSPNQPLFPQKPQFYRHQTHFIQTQQKQNIKFTPKQSRFVLSTVHKLLSDQNKRLIHKLWRDGIVEEQKSEVRYERAAEEKPHKETEV